MLKRFSVVFICLCIFCSAPDQSECQEINDQVKKYVDEYSDVKPTKEMLGALHQYTKYINYFCSFSYHRDNHNINPNYIRALICTESRGNPKAVSNDNAYGLTQIILPTAKRWGKELYEMGYDFKYVDTEDLKNLTKQDLFNPALNILLACYGTDKYNKTFGGNNMVHIAASWNAGHEVVLEHQTCPPYEETLRFVGKVNGYMTYFRENDYASHLRMRELPEIQASAD